MIGVLKSMKYGMDSSMVGKIKFSNTINNVEGPLQKITLHPEFRNHIISGPPCSHPYCTCEVLCLIVY